MRNYRDNKPLFPPEVELQIAHMYLVMGYSAPYIVTRFADRSRTGTMGVETVRKISKRRGTEVFLDPFGVTRGH